ncbi:MAG: hypothetical protein HUU35_03340 [Armatimonadetes bacterium]|nr:hypothetical protein [Armatimonadota bacterium]
MVQPEILALVQGGYYLASGLWPLVHLRSFLAVTGPKTDLWLVRTVAVLVVVIGLTLLQAGRSPSAPALELAMLPGAGAALGLTLIEVYHVAKRVISPIYLADALVELAIVAAWLTPMVSSAR